MRPAIIIKKMKENSLIYYVVSTKFEAIQCYIGIDAKNNRVLYFNNDRFENPIGTINFDLPDHLIKISGIELWISNRVAIRVYQAIQNNIFPNELIISN